MYRDKNGFFIIKWLTKSNNKGCKLKCLWSTSFISLAVRLNFLKDLKIEIINILGKNMTNLFWYRYWGISQFYYLVWNLVSNHQRSADAVEIIICGSSLFLFWKFYICKKNDQQNCLLFSRIQKLAFVADYFLKRSF